MKSDRSNLAVRQFLAKYTNTNPDDWFLTFRARLGMAVTMQAIYDIYGHGEVITQPYTCITAINPILAAKLRPVYADINPKTLSLTDPEKHYTNKTLAVIMQHTLGIISNDATKIANFAKQHKLILYEDSAHCATRMATDKNGAPLADISIHSFGVEKVIQNTKFGGAIYVNPKLRQKNPQLYEKITSKLQHLPQPPLSLKFRSRTYRLQNAFFHRLPSSWYQGARNLAYKAHLFDPAVAPYEQSGEQSRPYASTKFINETILKYLPTLPNIYKRRAKNTQVYSKQLATSQNYQPLLATAQPLLAFPILFPTADQADLAYKTLTTSGYFIRRWYSPLLYPGPTSQRIYHFNSKTTPTAEKIHPRILCLPTDLTPEKLKNILKILQTVENPV